MAKKQTQTGVLDASAMFQAGAAGAGTRKREGKEGLDIITKIGQYALGYYMKAAENLRDARSSDSKIFSQVEAFAADAGFEVSADISFGLINGTSAP